MKANLALRIENAAREALKNNAESISETLDGLSGFAPFSEITSVIASSLSGLYSSAAISLAIESPEAQDALNSYIYKVFSIIVATDAEIQKIEKD